MCSVARASLIILFVIVLCSYQAPLLAGEGGKAVVVAHRGASGYLPEHTLESYAFAYAQGADYVEQDLVLTKDGRFICRHDIRLDETTNVKEVFPDRKQEDGHWYAIDFTLAEIKQLRAYERLPNRFPVNNSTFEVPTFEEAIELVQGLNKTTGRNVGIYPELKDPGWHNKHGQPMEPAVLKILDKYGFRDKDARVFIQCFVPEPLMKIRKELGSALPLILLVGGDDQGGPAMTKEAMQSIAGYATGIGPSKRRIEMDPDLVKRAHDAGLLVHAYTLSADLVPGKYDSIEKEIRQFIDVYKVDGAFIDHPDKLVKCLSEKK